MILSKEVYKLNFSKLLIEIKWYFLKAKLQKIKLLILDVDGVMTDGYIYYEQNGNQIKRFSVKDGLGIRFLQKANIQIAIVTGGKGKVIKNRAKDLNIKYVKWNIKNKRKEVNNLKKLLNLDKTKVAYLGDDLNDLTVKKEVSLLVGTNDSSKDFKKNCDAVLLNNGGENAIRELAERIIVNSKFRKKIIEEGFYETN